MSATVGMEKAREYLKSAQDAQANGLYNAAAHASYYAMFWAAGVGLMAEGIEIKWKGPELHLESRHGDIQGMFNKELVYMRKLYPSEFTRYLDDGYKVRRLADYAHKRVEEKESVELTRRAEEFINTVAKVAFRDRLMESLKKD